MVREKYPHSEYPVLKIPEAVPKLKERERHPQGDERMDEQPAEDVVRHAPQRTVIAQHDLLELYPERRGVWYGLV